MTTLHPIFTDEMKEIVESFIIETTEIFEKLDNDLLQLEKNADDKDLVNRIFRAVHTVKGTAGFLSLDQMSILAHKFEDVLNKLRREELKFQPAMMDVMFEAFDLMKVLLKQVIDRRIEEINLDQTISKLESISRGDTLIKEGSNPVPAKDQTDISQSSMKDKGAKTRDTVGQDEAWQKVRENTTLTSSISKSKSDRITESTIRVDITRLDHLMNLVGELVLGRNRLTQIASTLSEEDKNDEFTRQLTETSTQIDFITTELQSAVMKTRMVPIGRVFNKFPRLVRDLSKEFSKEIELIVVGEETELDKSVIEEISDPLVHLIRNAVDHGIENPDERLRMGKPAKGTVILAARHEGNHIIIEVQDDGRGLDSDKLKQKAIEKGLISESEAREMKTEDCHDLIFLPGFSTAQKITNVSGRGVGMDVVKTNITRLNGIIEVDSSIGRGTKFTLKLPLTLAIIQGLLVDVGPE
ncbi:MAG: chemotaxis protein CheA, partial [Candidatus Kryptoniota bacterium]